MENIMAIDDFLALTALAELQKERATNIANENRLREENSRIKEKAKNTEAVLRIKEGFAQDQLAKAKQMMEANMKANLAAMKYKVEFYENLLKQDFETIALNNPNFEKTLNAEYDLLAKWMVSQKGFKETAIQFGLKLGHTEADVNDIATNSSLKIADSLVDKANPDNKFDIYEKSRIERVKSMIGKIK